MDSDFIAQNRSLAQGDVARDLLLAMDEAGVRRGVCLARRAAARHVLQ
jgi:hypothetical protein